MREAQPANQRRQPYPPVRMGVGGWELEIGRYRRRSSFVLGRWSLVGRPWSLVLGRWSLVGRPWSVVLGRWSLVVGPWSVVLGRSSQAPGRAPALQLAPLEQTRSVAELFQKTALPPARRRPPRRSSRARPDRQRESRVLRACQAAHTVDRWWDAARPIAARPSETRPSRPTARWAPPCGYTAPGRAGTAAQRAGDQANHVARRCGLARYVSQASSSFDDFSITAQR